MSPNTSPRNACMTQKSHPLLLPEVSRRLVASCFKEQLKVFRLVCRAWFDASLLIIRQLTTSKVKFSLDTNTTTGINVLKLIQRQENPMDSLNLLLIPIQNVTLVEPYHEIIWDEDLFTSFWNTCGNQLKSLKMTEKIPAVHVNSFIDTVLKCPNLENFDFSIGVNCVVKENDVVFCPSQLIHDKMTDIKISLDDFNEPLPHFIGVFHWENLFSRVPQLKALTLENNQFDDIVEVFSNILDAIGYLRNEIPNVLMLHYLNLGDIFTQIVVPTQYHKDLIKKLCNLQLPLKTFIVTHAWAKMTPFFAPVLLAHKNTLEDFRTTLVANSDEHQTRGFALSYFPPGLKRLEFPFKSLNVLKYTPNLASLIVDVEDFEQEIFERVNKFDVKDKRVTRAKFCVSVCKTDKLCLAYLNRFILSDYHGFQSPADFLVFTKWTPNLQYLAMNLNNVTFPMVCQEWKDLRFLAMFFCDVDTDGFCGITENTPRLPNITDLKYLKTILLLDLKVKLGNEAFTDGFLKLEFLHEFKIVDAGENLVCDEDILKLLQDKVPEFDI